MGRLECYCIYISMEQKWLPFCLLVCMFCARCLPLIQLELHSPRPRPPSLSCSFLVEVNSFCNSSDSPVTVRRGKQGFPGKKNKKKKTKADDESLDKSAASRRLPGFIVVLTVAAERKRPIESWRKERNSCCFVCLLSSMWLWISWKCLTEKKWKNEKLDRNNETGSPCMVSYSALCVWFSPSFARSVDRFSSPQGEL